MAKKLIEEKIVILPLECGRKIAEKLNGKTFDSISVLEDVVCREYSKFEQNTWARDVEELIGELEIYSVDEFVCRLNDEIYPTDQWVARVFIKS